MRVYRLSPDEMAQQIIPLDSEDWDKFQQFAGKPIGPGWTPVRIEVIREDVHLPPCDFPYLASNVPVFSERAMNVLGPRLLEYGEMLPLLLDDSQYFAMNVTRVVDALDGHCSDIVRFPDGSILDIRRYEFRSDEVGGHLIFKIPQDVVGSVLVGEEFVDVVGVAGLTGLDFRLLWDK